MKSETCSSAHPTFQGWWHLACALRNCQSCFLLYGGVLIARQYRLHRLHHRATVSAFARFCGPVPAISATMSFSLCVWKIGTLGHQCEWHAAARCKVTPSPTHTSCQTTPPSLRFQQPTATTTIPWGSIPETLSHVTSATAHLWGVSLFHRHSRPWYRPRMDLTAAINGTQAMAGETSHPAQHMPC